MSTDTMLKHGFKRFKALLTPAVIVAALGYFVDIYDLLLFSIVRKPSLESLGFSGSELTQTGLFLHNTQMFGMLLGGILWGVLGDKRGRLSVLFGSIALYSVANIANAFVHSAESYAFFRFFAGLGLAGELGAGITLVSEVLPKHLRGYGTMVVATVGVSGAIVAGIIGEYFSWRTNYAIGGALGIALLFLRIGVSESGLFHDAKKDQSVSRGNFLSLFSSKSNRRGRFFACILSGVPIWYVIGILMQLSPEYGKAFQISTPLTSGRAIVFCYSGLVLGDFMSGFLSQVFKTRIQIVRVFLLGILLSTILFFTLNWHGSSVMYYLICFMLGLFSGYWAVFVTIAAEQFGTNLRSTVATIAPNFVRGMVVPMNLMFAFIQGQSSIIHAAISVGTVALLIAFLSAYKLKDTFGIELNYLENI